MRILHSHTSNVENELSPGLRCEISHMRFDGGSRTEVWVDRVYSLCKCSRAKRSAAIGLLVYRSIHLRYCFAEVKLAGIAAAPLAYHSTVSCLSLFKSEVWSKDLQRHAPAVATHT